MQRKCSRAGLAQCIGQRERGEKSLHVIKVVTILNIKRQTKNSFYDQETKCQLYVSSTEPSIIFKFKWFI